jgi:hypothetical protein
MQVHETETQIKDAAFGFVHDFLVTDNYYVIVENATRMNFWKLLTQYTIGKACIAECLYQDKERPMKVGCSLLSGIQFSLVLCIHTSLCMYQCVHAHDCLHALQ